MLFSLEAQSTALLVIQLLIFRLQGPTHVHAWMLIMNLELSSVFQIVGMAFRHLTKDAMMGIQFQEMDVLLPVMYRQTGYALMVQQQVLQFA